MALQTPTFGMDMGGVTFKCNVVLESSVDSGVTCDSVLHHDGSVLVASSGTVGESTSVAKFTFATDPLITASCALAMGTNKITGLGDPASAQDAATKAYCDTFLPLAGGTMSGDIAMGTNKVTGMGDPSSAQDAATKNYCDTTFLALAGGTMSGNITMAEDGWIGIGSGSERIVFDGTAGYVEIADATLFMNDNNIYTTSQMAVGVSGGNRLAIDSSGTTLYGDNYNLIVDSSGVSITGSVTLDNNYITGVSYIQMDEDAWIGNSVSTERLVFDGTGGQIDVQGANLDLNANALVGVASITMDEDGWVGNSVSTERLVFDGTGGQIDVQGANLDLNSNGILAVASVAIVSEGWVGISSSAERIVFNEGGPGSIQLAFGNLDMNSLAIIDAASITMKEDAWVGIGVSSERLVFDGTGGIIEIQGAHTLHVGSNEAQFGDSGTKIAQRANSYLALTADGAVEIFGILELEATTSATGHITQAGTRLLHTTTGNIFLGSGSGNFTTSGTGRNVGIGNGSLEDITTGDSNFAGGHLSLGDMTIGVRNTGVGSYSLRRLTGDANYNTAAGYNAGRGVGASSGGVYLGYSAGYYETASNKLFIDNASRTNEADGRVKALVYGIFDAATANQELHFNANVYVLENLSVLGRNELRFYEGANYIGFEAPALAADQIWVLPPADGITGEVLTTDGAGNLSWTANASEKTWAFKSRDANTGTNYIGGFYKFATSANDFNPATTFGTANASYAAHVFLVQAAGASGGTDTVIRVTGTSIDDQGNRTAADFEDVTVDDAGAAGTYYETTVKWIGQVSIEKQSGPDLLCNYGFCKYWDNNNTDFKVVGVEATWLGAQNDATPDILLRHHTATGWTYNAGAAPTPPAAIVSMAGDHVTEIQIRTDEEGAWKRDNLSTDVDGSGIEGTIIELVTTANRTYAIGNFLVRITPQ